MNATRLLEQQHREVEALFAKLEMGGKDARATAKELAQNLLAHMVIEQAIFYPDVNEADEDGVHEAYEEHHIARTQINRLLATEADDETFKAKVIALKELIEHHVKEEEKELFPKVRKKIPEERLTTLGAAMKKEFEQLVGRLPRTLHAKAESTDVLSDATA